MTRTLILLFFIYFFSFKTTAQLQVFPAASSAQVTQWVQNVLVGQGVTVSNVSYTGNLNGIGRFQTGSLPTNIGFNAGMILASGNVTNAVGPNNTGSSGSSFGTPGDLLLNQLISGTTFDAAVLEFDFIPLSDTIKFRYAFGSEEYPEFVNSYNDVFGFFVSGLSPFGGMYTNKNIAIIPNTANTPVSIYNVNNGSSNGGPCVNCIYYVNNTGGTTIQYDGFTTTLTAWVRVIPCLMYHLKIAIADVGDGVYDSGVFLQANSFSGNSVIVSQSTTSNVDTIAVENCSDAVLTFSIPTPRASATQINFINGGSAIAGTDYTSIPSFVTIPAGQTFTTLTIHPLADNLTETTEYIRFIIGTSACTTDTVFVYIRDNQTLKPIVSNDTVLCSGASANLNIIGHGGYLPYSYLWSTGDTTTSVSVNPTQTQMYTVTFTDKCLNDTVKNILVKVSTPNYTVNSDSICMGETGLLTINHIGLVSYHWSTGATSQNISVNPITSSVYSVTVTDTLGCPADTSVELIVFPLPNLVVSNTSSICSGNSIRLWASGGNNYFWSNGETTDTILVNPIATTSYYVTVSSIENCRDSGDVTVHVLELPKPSFILASDTICKGASGTITAEGADNYLWSTGAVGPTITVSPVQSTTYEVIFSNESNGIACKDTASIRLGVKQCNHFYFPRAFSPNNDGINDDFGVFGIFDYIKRYEIIIYDRWGARVFNSTNVAIKWDGKNMDGGELMGGVYTYHVLIQETYGELYELNGTVTMIK